MIERWWDHWLPIRRGRNWVCHNGWDGREDGWWLFNYYAWAPRICLLPFAANYRARTGDNNFFYTMENRRCFSDDWLFGR